MWLSKYFVFFTIYSVMGWIYESTFCSIKEKKWANRGFLYGPVVPIYGVGGAALTIVVDLLQGHDISLVWWQLFLLGYFGSIVLEYSTHWALEKLFHAKWWDYSYMPLNIKGRICLPYSICFGLAALLVNYAIIPFTKYITSWITPIWFELFALLFMGIMAVDTALTVSALTDFNRRVIAFEESFNDHMDQFVASIQEKKLSDIKLPDLPELPSMDKIKEGVADVIPEEWRERLTKVKVQEYMAGINVMNRSALKRVSNYVNPKVTKVHTDAVVSAMKEKLPKVRRGKQNRKH